VFAEALMRTTGGSSGRKASSLLPALLLAALAPTLARAQVEVVDRRAGAWEIVGVVVEARSGVAVPTVDVVLRDSLGALVAAVVGDDVGAFRLRPPREGRFVLAVSRIGYAPASREIAFPAEGTLELKVTLAVSPVEVEGLVASGRARPRTSELTLAGFEARRREGGGTYFTEEEIDRVHPTRITDLLQRVPGVQVVRIGGRAVDIYVTSAQSRPTAPLLFASRPCFPTIWLDGVRVREGGYQDGVPLRDEHKILFLDDVIPPEQVGGIEVYTRLGRLPARFRDSSSSCGVIAVWSRR